MDYYLRIDPMVKLQKKAPEVAEFLRRKELLRNAMINPSPVVIQPPPPPGKFVSVLLRNGLGNRIFQILAALGYAEKYKKVCVICKALTTTGMKPHERNLDTMISSIFPSLFVVELIERYTNIVEQKQMNYTSLPSYGSSVVLQGYFQDEKYFPSAAYIPVIRTAYYPDTYFVHIRAGDYLDPGSFGLDLFNYHKKCFAQLSSIPNVTYIVFSNDNTYADNYMKQFGIQYTISNKLNPLEALIEMANCAGGICANSTFSWLGGFFQRAPRGQIFMPSVWLRGRDCSGIYPTWATVVDIGSASETLVQPRIQRQPRIQVQPTPMPMVAPVVEPEPVVVVTPVPVAQSTTKHLVSVYMGGVGIGNKIFMIFAGLAYAEKYDKEFVISRSINIGSSLTLHTQNLDTYLMKLFPNIRWIDSIRSSNNIYEEHEFIYNNLRYISGNITLHGYFQNEMYFPSYINIPDIRTSYYPDTFFLHIRAGDYLESEKYGFDLTQYYKNCLSSLNSNIKYIIFSNDNNYANNYIKQFNISYIISDKVNPLETLVEMANCAGGICANSSFSWLGAFFQGNKRGKIFMPSKWINNQDCNGIYPKWATIIDCNINNNISKNISCKIYDIFIRSGNIYIISTLITKNDPPVKVYVNNTMLIEYSINEWEPMRYFCGPVPAEENLIITVNNILYKQCNKNDIEEVIPVEKKHKLAFATLFKDDYPFLDTMIDHYRKQGVDYFYLYYNGSKLPENLPMGSDIMYKLWDIQPYLWKSSEWWHNAQTSFLAMFQQKYFKDNEWIILADLDELIINYSGCKITDVLNITNSQVVKARNHWAKLSNTKITYSSIHTEKIEKCIYRGSYKDWLGIHRPRNYTVSESNSLRMLHVINVLHPERENKVTAPYEQYILCKEPISVVYSLGIQCDTEIMLKKINLIKFSSIFGSMNMKSYTNIIRCFDTNFDILFNKENLVYSNCIPEFEEENKTHGFRTLNKEFDAITDYHSATIAHHDLSNKDAEEHFKRGIKRLEVIRDNKIPILFVNTSTSYEFNNSEQNIILIDSIRNYGFTNIKLLSIYRNVKETGVRLKYKDNYNYIYTMPCKDNNTDSLIIKEIINTHFDVNALLTIDDLKNKYEL